MSVVESESAVGLLSSKVGTERSEDLGCTNIVNGKGGRFEPKKGR
jgi:hypothetical protein